PKKLADLNRTLVMGVLNVTPDSFSDGGKFASTQTAIEHGKHMYADGADIVDIGGESTRPGADRISVQEELDRVIPVITELTKLEIPVSIDTMRAEVAAQAVKAGACIINDVSGGKADPEMFAFLNSNDLPYIISDVLDSDAIEERVQVLNYVLTHSKDLRPSVTLKISVDGEIFEEHAQVDGQYDAFMHALALIFEKNGQKLAQLTDYAVRIPPGGESDALCETIITWSYGGRELITRGLDCDQTVSAIKATQKMLNLI
ncbi:MAG: Homocitrate synthase, partial [Bacteroidota bacterium]